MKDRTYNLKVKVIKNYNNIFKVEVEGGGFVGTGQTSNLGLAFEEAFRSVIDQASEEMLKE